MIYTADGFDDSVDRKPPALARELQYFEKVKTRLKGNRDSYNDMLKCIHLFNQV